MRFVDLFGLGEVGRDGLRDRERCAMAFTLGRLRSLDSTPDKCSVNPGSLPLAILGGMRRTGLYSAASDQQESNHSLDRGEAYAIVFASGPEGTP